MHYCRPILFLSLYFLASYLAPAAYAYDYQNVITSHEQTFDAWEVALILNRNNRAEYIRMSTTLPGTKTEFEILFRRRYFDEPERIIYLFNRLSEPDVYLSPSEMKWVGSFALDERLYAVKLTHTRIGKDNVFTSIVTNPPEHFVYLIRDGQTLQFRMVNGFVYDIPLLGFRDAFAYVEQLKKELNWRYEYQWRDWSHFQ